jgi:hypothetical protein
LWWDERTPFMPSPSLPPPKSLDAARFLEEASDRTPEALARTLADRLVPGGVRRESVEKLAAFVANGKPSGSELAERLREAVHAILTMPEYQLA